jgi:hypothetical protein
MHVPCVLQEKRAAQMRKQLNRWAAAQMSRTSPLGRTLASHEKAGFEKAGMSREKDAGLPEGIFLLKER